MEGFLVGVLSSLVATLLVAVAASRPFGYPPLRAIWDGEYALADESGRSGRELIDIRWQFLKWFGGVFRPTEGEAVSYRFRGRFVERTLIVITFRSCSGSSDYGVGFFQLARNHKTLTGGAVSIDLHGTDRPSLMTYSAERHS